METNKFVAKDLGNNIFRIDGPSMVGMYLIIGSQKAALIDTACGIYNIADFISTLTEKKVEVFLTHGHYDHAGGIYYFDKVHMNYKDLGLLKENTKQRRIEFGNLVKNYYNNIDKDWTSNDVCEQRDIEIEDIHAGDVIDLGDRTLTVIDMTGHTKGSVAYYDDATHDIFVGDGCNNSTFMFLPESTTISEYLQTLENFKKEWDDKVNNIIICHDYDVVPRDCVDNIIECCNEILCDTDDKAEFNNPNTLINKNGVKWAKNGGPNREDGKFGNVAYRR